MSARAHFLRAGEDEKLNMENMIRLVGPMWAVEVLGVKLVGVNAENGKKLLLTLAFILLVIGLARLLQAIARRTLAGRRNGQLEFWTRQTTRLVTALVAVVGLVSIWFDDPARLATGLGLVTAGLAFALQKVITSVAGYFVILRGKTFNVGDRIMMGGVRGDVIGLDFIQTTIMEMGQPPGEQSVEAAVWVRSRQYTGRIVTVTNDKVFDVPVYNYTRVFPYVWDEMTLPIPYSADRARAEQILLEATSRRAVPVSALDREALEEMERRYSVELGDLEPKVYYRLTDNWLELTVRFITLEREGRSVKDAMGRDILKAFDEAGIGIASATVEIVGLPPLLLQRGVRGELGNGARVRDPVHTG